MESDVICWAEGLEVYKTVQKVQWDNKKMCWYQLRAHKNIKTRRSKRFALSQKHISRAWRKIRSRLPFPAWKNILVKIILIWKLNFSLPGPHTRKWKFEILQTRDFGEIIQMRIVEQNFDYFWFCCSDPCELSELIIILSFGCVELGNLSKTFHDLFLNEFPARTNSLFCFSPRRNQVSGADLESIVAHMRQQASVISIHQLIWFVVLIRLTENFWSRRRNANSRFWEIAM